MSDLLLTFIPFKNFDLLYSRVLEPEPHQNFRPEPELHKNDAALQHWNFDLDLFLVLWEGECAGPQSENTVGR
jgi:hypothetical protein